MSEKNYGKCPHCDAPCEVITKIATTNMDGDIVTMPYDEYNYHPQPGAVWVKASERLPGYETPVKWRDGKDHSHVTDGKIPLIHMAKPFLTGWEWFDEGTPAAGREEITIAVFDFIRDCATNWDHDSDSHKYDTPCRMCDAKKLYELFKQQNK